MKKVRISQKLFDFVTESPEFTHGALSSVHLSRDGKMVIKKPLPDDRRRIAVLPSTPTSDKYHEAEIRQFQFMQQHPDIFVEIKRIGGGYVVADNLNTSEIETLYDDLNEILLPQGFHLQSLKTNLLKYNELKDPREAIDKVDDEKLKKFGNDYFDLLLRFSKVPWKSYTPLEHADFHPGNLGYDANGKLKLLDF